MNKKNLFFAAVVVTLCALCTSCSSNTDYYLEWDAYAMFGDANAQVSMMDSACMVEASACNYELTGDRIIKLNTTDKSAANEKIKVFAAAVENRLLETGRFSKPDIDENGDYKNQTCYITYSASINISKSTDKVKMKNKGETIKYGFIYK